MVLVFISQGKGVNYIEKEERDLTPGVVYLQSMELMGIDLLKIKKRKLVIAPRVLEEKHQ